MKRIEEKKISAQSDGKKTQKKKRNLYEIIKKSVENMNSFPSSKYKQTPSEIKFIKLRN